jgi:hypothetical protein
VQILDKLVMLYDLRDHTQVIKEVELGIQQELTHARRASVANRLLETVFKINHTVTPAEKTATEVYDKVLRETLSAERAESAFDVTLALANSK